MILRMPSISRLIDLHNESREKSAWFNLPLLSENSKLTKYAQNWAERMAQENDMRHSSIKDIMSMGFSRAAENIAYGQKDEESVMRTWLRSPGHRRNIMNKHYTEIGAGFYYSDTELLYWCVCFGKKKN